MTDREKSKIIELRKKGYGFGQISKELNIPRSSVSTFCQRNNINIGNLDRFVSCKNCERVINLENKKKPRIFCSDECRVCWWNTHQNRVNKKAIYEFDCPKCGNHFTTYGNKKQKYCSHNCYIAARYGKVQENND